MWFVDAVSHEARHALRRARRHIAFSAATTLSLAMAVGGVAAVFGLEEAISFRALPYSQSDRLVSVQLSRSASDFCPRCRRPMPEALTGLIKRSSAFESVSAYRAFGLAVRDEIGAEYVRATQVDPAHFSLLGVAPMLGRLLQPADVRNDAELVMVASYNFWRKTLGADLDAVGKMVTMISEADGVARAYTVIGVMPRGFDVPPNTGVWLPRRAATGNSWVVARLAPGVHHTAAELEMRRLLYSANNADPSLNGTSISVLPLRDDIRTWSGVTNQRFVLAAVVLIVLVLACTNLVMLFWVRAADRKDEMFARAALGASIRRLIAPHVADILLTGALGGAMALLVAFVGLGLIRSRFGYYGVPLEMNSKIVVFALALTGLICVAIAAALVPYIAVTGTTRDLRGAPLPEFGRGNWLQGLAVVIQVSGAVVLSAGAAQGVQQVLRLERTNLGFDPQGLISVAFPSDNSAVSGRPNWSSAGMRWQIATDVELLSSLEGVTHAAAHGWGQDGKTRYTRGQQVAQQVWEELPSLSVTTGYFRTFSVPIVLGRAFGPSDVAAAPNVAIVSKSAARALWPSADPIGKTVVLRDVAHDDTEVSIVGVVPDIKLSKSEVNSGAPVIYRPFDQAPLPFREYFVRTGDARVTLPSLFRAVDEMRPGLSQARYPQIKIIADEIEREAAGPRLRAVALMGLALCAALLAAIGTFGLVAHSVRTRTREIAIRVALGAPASTILTLIARRATMIGLTGVAVGVSGSLLFRKIAGSLAIELGGMSIAPVLVSMVASIIIVGVAAYLPARRALGLQPNAALHL
jgi:predicted permease